MCSYSYVFVTANKRQLYDMYGKEGLKDRMGELYGALYLVIESCNISCVN